MTDAEYILTQERMTALASLALTLDIDGFLSRIATAEAVGPILNPTLYMKATDDLNKVKGIALAVKELQKAARAALPVRPGVRG